MGVFFQRKPKQSPAVYVQYQHFTKDILNGPTETEKTGCQAAHLVRHFQNAGLKRLKNRMDGNLQE